MDKAKNIGIITQARMTSTRLPGKILMEANGKPMLEYHLNRLGWSGLPVYIATTVNTTDDPIIDFAIHHHIPFCRGSEENVLSRYYDCAIKNELDIIVRVTSDCPLIDGKFIREGVEKYIRMNDPDLYISNTIERTFPRGMDFEIFSFSLLEEAFLKADLDFEKEHVTPYINRNRSGRVKFLNIPNNVNYGNLRITLDTLEDFELIKQLLEDYNSEKLDCEQITNILVMHPELVEINAHVAQKKI